MDQSIKESSMDIDKKRSVQDDNTINGYAKKHKEDDGYVLSQVENKLLSIRHWYNAKSYRRNLNHDSRVHVKDMYNRALCFIRPAYCSVRKTNTDDDMVKLLRDKNAMLAIIGLANLFRSMRRFSLCMRAVRMDLLTKLKLPLQSSDELHTSGTEVEKCSECKLIHPQEYLTHPQELVRSGNGHCNLVHEKGGDQFSIKVHNMLLIVDEMLIQMGLDPVNVKGYEDAKLSGMVEHRMNLLRTEMEEEEKLLIELIKSKPRSKFASACEELRNDLFLPFDVEISSSRSSVICANKEKHPSLQKVSDFIDGLEFNWHSCPVVGGKPTPEEQALFRKRIQDKLDLMTKQTWAELETE